MQQTSSALWALSIHRAWAGMTQEELAEASGVSRGTISRLEAGAQEPRPSTARKLAETLGVEPQDLADYETLRVAGNRSPRS
jgi:transcriptional regulator with XRE-family HTH domain